MEEISKIPPQAIDIEEAVIGAILVEGNTFTTANEYVNAASFYKEANQIIYSAIEELFYINEPIDVITVTEKLKNKGRLEDVGGAYYIAGLTVKIGSAMNIENHAKIIAEKHMRREFIRLSYGMLKSMYDENTDLLDEINNFDNQKTDLISFTKRDEKHISQAIDEMKDYSIKLARNEIERGYPTGFKYYDNFSGGMQKGDLIIIAGETSNGKTTLGLNIAKNTADAGNSVAIFSYEMTIFQLTARMVAHELRVSSKDIIRGELSENEIVMIGNDTAKLKRNDTYLIKPSGTSFARLIADVSRMVKLYKLDVVVIDYLQLLSNAKKNASQADMVAEMANKLKSLAVELNITVILLSQLARDRNKPRPTLARLKGSGDIENAADVVVFTYLPYKYNYSAEDVSGETVQVGENAIIIVGKGRNIGTTEFMLEFKKEIPAFFNYNSNPNNVLGLENYSEPLDFTPFDNL